MTLTSPFSQKSFRAILSSATALLLSLSVTAPVLAEYNPPSNATPPRSGSSSTGIRGLCTTRGSNIGINTHINPDGNSDIRLTALAPASHVGRTTSSHPSLVWFVPESQTLPVEVNLYEESTDRLIKQANLQSAPGLMRWTLPADEPGLTAGTRYYWEVIITCDPNHPSSDVTTTAEIEVVPPSATLTTALNNVRDPLARARLYADAGFWYDALNEVFNAQNSSSAQALRISLIERLAELEPAPNVHGDQLRKIAAQENQESAQP